MQWLSENLETVFALIGGIFVVLRLVVALTPTPKDDQLVRKASNTWEGILGALAKGAGLDTTQGRAKGSKKKGFMSVLLCTCIMMSVTGCGAFQTALKNERARLVILQKSFASSVRTLTHLNEAGEFSDEEQDRITVLIDNADRYLKEWEDSVKLGLERPDLLKLIIPTLIELNELAGRDTTVPRALDQ